MRKVLSFVLVLALVLGSFSFAFGLTDIDESANKEAIQVCNDLGIIDGYPDGTFQGDKAVNRAEFAAMITRALGVPDSALAGYATTSFKDVAGYGWAVPYLAFCESKGIMLGDGMGNAMPGRTISVNEAITMALRAVGYTENSAMLVGSWPANYVTLGQQQGLYTDLATATTIDRENAAQVIYNALSVNLVSVNADGETTAVDPAGAATTTTMLESYLNCTNEGKVVLGTAGFDFDNSLINIASRLGAYGDAYYNDDDELVAFTQDSTALTGYINADGKFVADGVKYTVEEVGLFTTGSAVFVNGGVTTSNTALTIKTSEATFEGLGDGGVFTVNAKVSAKVIKDVYSVVAWAADDAQLADSDVQDVITDDQKLLGFSFDTDDSDEIVTTSFELVGATSLSDIEEDDVVYVYADGTTIRKVAVGTETVTGTVEEVNVTDNTVIIAGTEYDVAELTTAAVDTAVTAYVAGNEGVLYLDAFGEAFSFDVTSADESNYGVVMDVQAGGTFAATKAAVYTSADKKVIYSVDDDVEGTYAFTATPALVSYSLDADGVLDSVSKATYSNFAATKAGMVLDCATDTAISKDVVVYSVSGTAVDLESINDVTTGAMTTVSAIVKDSKVVALLIPLVFFDSDTDATIGVFDKLTAVKDGDDNVQKLYGFVDGAAFTALTKGTSTVTQNAIGTYGVFKVVTDANGVVTADLVAITTTQANGAQIILGGGTATASAVNTDRTLVTVGTDKREVAEDAVFYEFDATNGVYSIASSKTLLGKGDKVMLIDVAEDDTYDSVADIVIFQ